MNFYENIDRLVLRLDSAGHQKYATQIKEAKASGCVASEILYLVREELKRYPSVLGDSEKELGAKIEELIKKISHLLK